MVIPLTFLDSVSFGLKKIPISLIGHESRKRLLSFASLWPIDFKVSLLGMECSLQDGDGWGDFRATYSVPSENFSTLLRSVPIRNVYWDRVVSLLKEWNDSGYLADWGVSSVDLACDVGSCSDWPPKPNIYFTFNHIKVDPSNLISEAYSRLYEMSPSFFLSAFQRFVEGNSSFVVGFMLSRPGYVRAGISTQLSDIYAKMNSFPQTELSGVFDSFKELVCDHSSLSDCPIGLGVNILPNGKLSPRIGVTKKITPRTSPEEIRFILERLSAAGLISDEKKSALFPYVENKVEPFYDLPSDYYRFSSRRLDCLKFVCIPNENTQVKAYFRLKNFAFHKSDYTKITEKML